VIQEIDIIKNGGVEYIEIYHADTNLLVAGHDIRDMDCTLSKVLSTTTLGHNFTIILVSYAPQKSVDDICHFTLKGLQCLGKNIDQLFLKGNALNTYVRIENISHSSD
jgi:hypothetical protein